MKYGILIRLILTDNIQDKLRLFTGLSLFFLLFIKSADKIRAFCQVKGKADNKNILYIY